MAPMNLLTKQKQYHRCRKQTYGYHDADVFCILPEDLLRSDFRKVNQSPEEGSQTEHFCYRGNLWQKTELWLHALLLPDTAP